MMIAIVVGHLQAFIDTAIDVVIHFRDSKWAKTWKNIGKSHVLLLRSMI